MVLADEFQIPVLRQAFSVRCNSMKQLYRLLLLTAITICSCSAKTNTIGKAKYPNLPILTLCDLAKNPNKKVYIKCIYSGADEYWTLGFIKSNKCDSIFGVDLDFDQDYEMPLKFKKLMTKVHNDYWNSSLVIEAIGMYETGQEGGYGHLGTNKSRFIVSKIISMKFRKNKMNYT